MKYNCEVDLFVHILNDIFNNKCIISDFSKLSTKKVKKICNRLHRIERIDSQAFEF